MKWAPNNLCPPHSHCVRSGQCPDICPGTACVDTVAVLTSAHSAVLTPPWPTIAMRMPVQFTVVFVSHFLYVQPPVLRVTYVPPFLPPPHPLGRGPVRLRRSERISCRRGCACPAPLARPACRRARSFRGRHTVCARNVLEKGISPAFGCSFFCCCSCSSMRCELAINVRGSRFGGYKKRCARRALFIGTPSLHS